MREGRGMTHLGRLIVERPGLWRLAVLALSLVLAACQPGDSGGGGDPGGGGDGY
jgi:hypothetical protein